MVWFKKGLFYCSLLLLSFFFFFFLIKDLKKSYLFTQKDRLNLVFLQENPLFYSFDLKDRSSYMVVFFPDLKAPIPGGYGEYRLGGLLKLVELEKNPKLIQSTFSALTNTLVDLYYYPDKASIYFGSENRPINKISLLVTIMKSKSNARFFDRLLTYYLLLNQKDRQQLSYTNKEKFFSSVLGYFYNPKFRRENKNLQLVYSQRYPTALKLSQILEGEGIRVADISQSEGNTNINQNCVLAESSSAASSSQTATYLANYFQCELINNQATGVYDLIFYLNNLEKQWEIN